MKQFFDSEGNLHVIDNGRNHFVNGVCVNPLSPKFNQNVPADRLGDIGDTYKNL